ncbi:MAG: IclR family transcriptional regulator [Nocardioides sp.]
MSAAATGTQAVDRAALLISTVVESSEPMAFAELAEGCGLPKSTTSRILTALERTELVERTEDGEYVAGALFNRFAARHDAVDLAALALPVLQAVGDVTGETVNLGVPRGRMVAHVAQVDSTFLLGTRDWTEVEVPNHASALGKVLLASGALPLPTGELVALTDTTLTDPARLRAALDDIRRQGFAVTTDELELGLTGIAVPVHESGSNDARIVAALGISGPTTRLSGRQEALARLLIDQAARLTTLLGDKFPWDNFPWKGVA